MKTTLLLMVFFLSAFGSVAEAADNALQPKAEEQAATQLVAELTVNINTGSIEQLASILRGIGKQKAANIIDYRDSHGQFQAIEDLTKVKGIGLATVEKNRALIRLQD